MRFRNSKENLEPRKPFRESRQTGAEKPLNPPGTATPMRPRPFLLLLAGVALALMAAGEADAKEPEWSYETGGWIDSLAISADGEYIAAGSNDDKVYLFGKNSSTGGSPVGTIDSIEPSPTEKGTAVFFNGTGSDTDGNVVAYLWKSSIDGELSTEEDFTTTNLSIGNHTITFMVQDNDGFTDTDTVEVTISEKKVQIDDEGNVTVTDAEEDEEGIPTLSVITTMAAVAVIALRRRY